MLALLAGGLKRLGFELTPAQLDKFEIYRTELLQWNQRVNLTAITDPGEIETRHFIDSLTVLRALETHETTGRGLRMIDVGTGAGFPGIPLKLVLPDAHLTLLEATRKKADFLSHIVALLDMRDTEVVYGRAEELAHRTEYREAFNLAVARAVAPLATLAELCLPFVCVGGLFVAMKKGDIEAELERSRSALATVGGGEARLIQVSFSELPDRRCLVSSTKVLPSDARYPRRPGIPSKRPL
jgi:16S rRNA (guanine527-N7)-methyltransferase